MSMCRFTSVSISSAMWIEIVQQLKAYNFSYVQRTYRRLLPKFLKESGIHGLKPLLATPKWRYAKITWLLFLIYIIIQTHLIIINLVINYMEQPTEIRMSTHLVHVANIPFPAVAICSANKFKRSKLLKYAELVYQAQQRYRPKLLAKSVSEMAEHLLIIGGFYVHPFYDYAADDTRAERLHNILLHMYDGAEYPTREIMRDMAPDCEDLVVRVMVFGKRVNVSRYFQRRMTSTSSCCMFNYRRESYASDAHTHATDNENAAKLENVTFDANAILNSIHLVLQDDSDETTFTEMDNDAFQLYLFPKEDYPIIQSDTSGAISVNKNSIVEIPVQPTFYGSSVSIRDFSPKVRKCYFVEEGKRLLNLSYYSFDECLLICRMQSMIKYCGCVNPPMPASLINATQCSLLQLACLSKWKRVWNDWSYFSYVGENEDDAAGQVSHSTTVQQCPHCLPTCRGVNYKIEVNEQPLRKASGDSGYKFGLLKGLTSTKPLAIIKLFFKLRYAQSTESDIVSNWVVLLNRFGGIMSLMYGFSIIGYIEIVYYLSGKWLFYICKACQLQEEPRKAPRKQPQALTMKRKKEDKHREEHTIHDKHVDTISLKAAGHTRQADRRTSFLLCFLRCKHV